MIKALGQLELTDFRQDSTGQDASSSSTNGTPLLLRPDKFRSSLSMTSLGFGIVLVNDSGLGAYK